MKMLRTSLIYFNLGQILIIENSKRSRKLAVTSVTYVYHVLMNCIVRNYFAYLSSLNVNNESLFLAKNCFDVKLMILITN